MQSAATLTYSKVAIAGVEKLATHILDIDGVAVSLAYGYPDGTASGIDLLMDVPSGDWKNALVFFLVLGFTGTVKLQKMRASRLATCVTGKLFLSVAGQLLT